MYGEPFADMSGGMCVDMCTHMCIHIYIHVCVDMCIHRCAHMCTHMSIHICVYTCEGMYVQMCKDMPRVRELPAFAGGMWINMWHRVYIRAIACV